MEDEYEKIEAGQVWVSECENDYIVEILSRDDETVTWRHPETGDVWRDEIEGNDGFKDYLESNLYHLKT